MSNITHFSGYSIVNGDITIDISFDRLEKKLKKAQFELDTAVMNSMLPFMPFRDGTLQQRTRTESSVIAGTGKVCAAAAPYGRFLYMGKVMIGEKSRSPWAKKDEKKIITDRTLKFHRAGAVPEWFDVAKSKDLEKWVQKVKRFAGGEGA